MRSTARLHPKKRVSYFQPIIARMTPVSYVYKITFLEVPHWYWGWHTERKAGEHYMGSPSTHKEYWERYTPIKEIVRVFENTPDGKLQAQLLEKELIRPDLNNPFCLN